ncbi:uncharacterized protein LOC107274502 isoform X3 [Cephus cinctus]|uniref:Uncharacterized protein LOC107274502 isoform X3 n=1 Tax=Cephus cinctus TaxID=211228 RepID=A0AAJ7RUY6_CEPCN|nr:uncharacterized protein LOC107274502 isoform X3 [Cephus cinctus]
MSGADPLSGNTSPIHQPRQSRTHSVGLPARTSLFPEPPPTGNDVAPPIPRRHSATPTVAPPPIPLRPPTIPKRSKNERPIPISKTTVQPRDSKNQKQSYDQSIIQKESRGTPPKIPPASWHYGALDSKKLIDVEFSRKTNSKDCFMSFDKKCAIYGKDFDRSSFAELQRVSRDLEKRLHERVVRSVGVKFGDLETTGDVKEQRHTLHNESTRLHEQLQADELQFAASDFERQLHGNTFQNTEIKLEELQNARIQDIESRFHERLKFDELQNTSRDLEKRLHEKMLNVNELSQQRIKYDIDMERARNILQSNLKKERIGNEKLEKLPKATQTNMPPPLSSICQSPVPKPMSVRQDSNVSSDSFSQTSSPSYTSKTMEAPLLPHKQSNGKVPDRALAPETENPPGSPITKSISTPASLQTIVRFHSGSNMSLHHKIIRDIRRPSSHYVTRGRLRFRFAQVLVNAVALLAIAGGMAAYFKFPVISFTFGMLSLLRCDSIDAHAYI